MLYRNLNDLLGSFLKGTDAKIEPPPQTCNPIFLILSVNSDLICFATLSDKFEEDYSKAFQNFKNLYSINSNKWADYDLTLVFCNIAKIISEEFCNKIELDPYFCRKFVIDSENLETELKNLPFIPLHSGGIEGLKRITSSQTLLMNHRVNTELAKYLAVPHLRSENGIIEDCTKGLLGTANWMEGQKEEFLSLPDTEKTKVRLKELEITNFRAYTKTTKFDIDANLVILYGPNGFGKTSFFDAIDFVCTGSVGRFEAHGFDSERLVRVLHHLDSSREDSFVKATINKDGKEIEIKRYLKDRNHAYLGELMKDRNSILIELAGLLEEPPDLRVDNLARLFRASHLFGQEFQSLMSEFTKNSKLPQETVSRMFAMQDYVEAINKSRKVIEELKGQINEKESGIIEIKEFLKRRDSEIKELEQSVKVLDNPKTLLAKGKVIAERIYEVAKVSLEVTKDFTQETIRNWRSILEEKIVNITQMLETYKLISGRLKDFQNNEKDLSKKNLELKQKKEYLPKLLECSESKNKELEILKEKIKTLLLQEKTLSIRREILDWLSKMKIEYERLRDQLQNENKIYKSFESQLLESMPKIAKQKSAKDILEKNLTKTTTSLKELQNKFDEIEIFKKEIAEWQKISVRQIEVEGYITSKEKQNRIIADELRDKKQELNRLIIEHQISKKNLDDLQQVQTELKTLLDNIEKYINSDKCPVCGTSHQSKQELIQKLNYQRGVQPQQVQNAIENFEKVREKVESFKKDVGVEETKYNQLIQEITNLQKELVGLKDKQKSSERKAMSLDIDAKLEKVHLIINTRQESIRSEINIKQKEVSSLTTELKKESEQYQIFSDAELNIKQNLENIRLKQNRIQTMQEEIRGSALEKQVFLESEDRIIKTDLAKLNEEFEKIVKEIRTQQSEEQKLQKEANGHLQEKNILEKEIAVLELQVAKIIDFNEEVKKLLKELNLGIDISLKDLSIAAESSSEKLVKIELLRKEVMNLEIVMDSIQSSAILTSMRQEALEIKNKLNDGEREQKILKEWKIYFENINNELVFVQRRSLSRYVETYGPLSSIIQRRLRSVYGFKDIELSQEKGNLVVRVSRKEQKNIPPTDYFSGSQIQILMLSLFLSATLTQTWSSFAPILLDDPVTHFDDLNAYSLLDFIKGLINESKTSPQFIISTCEQRLFRLMRQKFNKMKEKVIFYEFESIGETGPKIIRIS